MQKQMEAIVGTLYDGVLMSDAWCQGLADVCQQVDAGVFHSFSIGGAPSELSSVGNLESVGLHSGLMKEYEEHHASNDLRMSATLGLATGQLMLDHEHLSPLEMSRNSVYADWLIPLGVKHTAATRVRHAGSVSEFVSFMRFADAKPFGTYDRLFIERLMPHLSRAAALRARMGELSRQASLGIAALQTLPQGLVVVDAQCRIHFANPAAERLMTPPSAMNASHQRLKCASEALQTRLQHLVAQACGNPGKAGAFDSLVSASQTARLVVTVLPLKSSHVLAMSWQKPLALVILTVPGAIGALDHRLVSDMLGLSPTEARLLLLLAAGKSVKDFALVEGCSWHTARAHMKNLMRKTGCHKQVELVQLLQALQVG
ncbi:LuxR family transcriptional regulator [Diaphorobacter sp. HDW4B]|uniref:LuxR C-terminal-related transcriptional regulator n=1 Tax=Diaphorobacter sp. HDW4B TaxID=2714925 RepID=UPI0014086C98|nr:LuxR C-terminal-related transcriptional regulator [Diaphorobacter sp. HDW4B]QIL69048.1 LuxR family transcriptional regulator [Diaphorobacter sp. HDW4B]